MGVWIETKYKSKGIFGVFVTPYVGVWIETAAILYDCDGGMVTPYVGVWIETVSDWSDQKNMKRHSLCGSVD